MLLRVDCMQITVPEERLRKRASVTVPVLKGVPGSGTLPHVAETHDRVVSFFTKNATGLTKFQILTAIYLIIKNATERIHSATGLILSIFNATGLTMP